MKYTTKYPISEIFTSIQGEGAHLGRVATFIRLEGCNLRCPWCDTSSKAFVVKDEDYLSIPEIIDQVKSDFVVITGGEPTIHPLKELVDALHEIDCIVTMETNGTNRIPDDWEIDWITVSPKPPLYIKVCYADELKFVCDDVLDYQKHILPLVQHNLAELIWIQPEGHKKESIKRAIKMVHEHPAVLRMGIQLHKIIGVE